MPRGPIERAVHKDLDGHLLASPLGQATLAAAKRMDNAMADDRDFATLAREFRAQLKELLAEQPPATRRDGIDDLSARRSARRTAGG